MVVAASAHRKPVASHAVRKHSTQQKWLGETKDAIAFNDINHNAPVHILVIPKQRFDTVLDAPPEIVAEMVGLAVNSSRARSASYRSIGLPASHQY